MQFLIVEDETISRRILLKTLDNYGRCQEAENGALALELFAEALRNNMGYDVVTLDISLPGMSGLDVLLKIRGVEKAHKVPPPKKAKIIVITSHVDKDHVNPCIPASCDGYIIKPIDPPIILQSIKSTLLKYVNDNY